MKNPSDRQLVIKDTWINKAVNILIRAVAGSGKTSTIIWLTKLLPNKKYLILAFSKDVVEELIPKVSKNTDVSTMHSFGLKLLRFKYKSVNVKLKIHQQKIIKHVRNRCENLNIPNKIMWSTSFYLIEMLDQMRIYNLDYKDIKSITKVVDTKIFGFPPSIKEDLLEEMWFHICKEYYKCIKYDTLWCDFIDMIYIPVFNSYEIKKIPYNYICVDEAQDLSALQHAFFNLLTPSIDKWISVGDNSQCQPAGTKILMKDLSEKNIEDIKKNDEVITYHKLKSHFIGYNKHKRSVCRKVEKTKVSFRKSIIHEIQLESGHNSKYTNNHKCYVQLNKEKCKGKYIVYLMEKKGNFRIGIAPILSDAKLTAFYPTTRARNETANKLWVLDIYDNKVNAYMHEQYYSYKYGIPQLRFKDNNNQNPNRFTTQKNLDLFWKNFDFNINKIKKLLNEFGREYKFPLWENTLHNHGGIGNSWKLSFTGMFKTQACNIIPSIMNMCIFDKSLKDSKSRIKRKMIPISKMRSYSSTEKFYSLKVESEGNYVADGILTSNSIFGFTGACTKSFELFLDKENVIELPLDINYRSGTEIVKDANRTLNKLNAPLMVPFKTNSGSVIVTEDVETLLTLEPNETKIICRNSAPLFDIYFYLLGKSIPVTFKGKDIYASLNKFLQPYKFLGPYQAYNKIDTDLHNMILKSNKTEQDGINLFMFKENVQIYSLLYAKLGHKFNKVSDLLDHMKVVLNNKTGKGMLLSTIHKAKGLEAENVVILNIDLIPSKYAKTPDELLQEENLRFVAQSRAMENTIYLNIDTEIE